MFQIMTDFWEPADELFVLIGGNGDPNVIQTGDHDIASVQTPCLMTNGYGVMMKDWDLCSF